MKTENELLDMYIENILTQFFNELKDCVGTYRIRDIETERAVKSFLKGRNEKK